MKKYVYRALTLAAGTILLTACRENSLVTSSEASQTESEASRTESEASQTGSKTDSSSAYISKNGNANIDTSIYLDYSAGINAGVYRWILSEDGSYYTLAAVDEDGEAIETEAQKINVGANNEEAYDNGKAAGPGGTDGLGMNERPQNDGGKDMKSQPKGDGKGMDGQPKGDSNIMNGQPGSDDGNIMNGQPKGDGNIMNGQPGSDDGNIMNGQPKGDGQDMMPGGMMHAFEDQGTVFQGVYINGNITNTNYQTMLIYVPSEYLTADKDGNVTGINHEGACGNYTADTAPVVYLNEMGGWRSSSPKSVDIDYINQGMIYVSAGGRSRDALDESGTHSGKSPLQMADLKSGIIELRANTDVIPGDMNKIISVGTSGGGQMSSMLGASGNMPEYYEYMYETATLGVTKNADGSYSSQYPDNVYGAQLYCPIADIENADLAYAWWWVDLVDDGGIKGDSITDFERELQELEAEAFVDYINSLGLKDPEGNTLTLTGLRSGSYYDAILENISDALNAAVKNGDIDPEEAYPDSDSWLSKNSDGSYSVTDMKGFMIGTGLVNNRNKAIPGFDTFDKSAENNAFGKPEDDAVHFSASVAKILSDNYDRLSALDGFNKDTVDEYINEALTGDEASLIERQTDLLNATEILLGNNGLTAVDPALYWRDRSGTADQHTSFSIGYNILLAAGEKGLNVDYHLVWNMGHGSNEGTGTGTLIDWINEICG